jgi:2'-5' RNA ligase
MNRKMTVPIAKAQEMAKTLGEDFVATVAALLARGIEAVTIEAAQTSDGTWDIGIAEPDGVMVALMIPDYWASEIALPGGEPAGDLHITLAYLGNAADLSLDDQRKLIGTVGEVAMRTPALRGNLTGTGRFVNGEDEDAFWIGVDIPGLESLQKDLAYTLNTAGFKVADDFGGYTPHVTVAWIPKDLPSPAVDFAPVSVCFDDITVCVGGQRLALDLQSESDEVAVGAPSGWTPAAINKAIGTIEPDRYTLAPFYLPGTLDAHNEHTDAREIEKAFWGYMAKEDNRIRLQHNTDIVAGRRVDGVVWPLEVTVPLTKADGTQTMHTFPAGTPWLGTIWEPWAWDLIQEGKINGYSMGGTATMLEVDLEGGEDAYHAAAPE